MTTYEPQHLAPYKRPSHYFGATYEGCYGVYGRHRDSGIVTRSNWRVLLRMFGDTDGVIIHSANHWAVGWVEEMYVDPREASNETLQELDEAVGGLENYPILDEFDFSELEHEEACQWWNDMGLAERVSVCQRARVSIFAARHVDEIPEACWDYVRPD